MFRIKPSEISIIFEKLLEYFNHAFGRDKYHVIIEISLLLFIVTYFLHKKKNNPKKCKPLSLQEKNQLIEEWQPEPLTSPVVNKDFRINLPEIVIDKAPSTVIESDGKSYVNFVSSDFLSIANHDSIKKKASEAIKKYAVGSCGPRGFYGTTELHLALEKKIASFYGSDDCVIYADNAGCISSVISAFSKKGDLIVCDEGCNYFIKLGVRISHSEVLYYRHNDLNHLEQILKEIKAEDVRTGRKITRRFIITEVIYQNYGDVADIPSLIRIKRDYKFRLIIDDSLSVGVLSARGCLDYWSVQLDDIDIYCGSFNHAYGSCCNFYVGDSKKSLFQRLGSSGYCFSASAPPFTLEGASAAIDLVSSNPSLILKLGEKCEYFWNKMNKLNTFLIVSGDRKSPIVHLREKTDEINEKKSDLMLRLVIDMRRNGFLVDYCRYREKDLPKPSVKVFVTISHSDEQINHLVENIERFLTNEKI